MGFVTEPEQVLDGKVLLMSVGTLPEGVTRAVGFRKLFNSKGESKDIYGILVLVEFEQGRKSLCCSVSVGVGRTRGASNRSVRID